MSESAFSADNALDGVDVGVDSRAQLQHRHALVAAVDERVQQCDLDVRPVAVFRLCGHTP